MPIARVPHLLPLSFLCASLAGQEPTSKPAVGPAEKPAVQKAQTPALPTSITQTFEIALIGVEGMLVGAAEAMPEDKFGYVPTGGEFKDVRTFAQQIKHVAAANFMAGERISGAKPTVDVANSSKSMQSKEEIMKFLKDSFVFARKAVAEMKEAELYTPVPSPWGSGQTARMMLVMIPIAHSMDHYGQMAIYLRHNGIVPPASRR